MHGAVHSLFLLYTEAALDYLALYQLQEMASPFYLRRMERRMKRENNQEFFFPPSRAVPRGGGSAPFEGVRWTTRGLPSFGWLCL